MKNLSRTARRAALLGCVSLSAVAAVSTPSYAEQQVFKFFVNTAQGTGKGSFFKGPGCDAGSRTPGDGCVTFVTTSSQAGAMSEASSIGIGTHGSALPADATQVNDAYDGYGELTGGTRGGGGSPNAPIDNQQAAPNNVAYGGLTVTRDVETTLGNTQDPDSSNPDGTTVISTPYTGHGIANAARFFETFTNNTASTITTKVSYTNNLGSDNNTVYESVGANNTYLTSIQAPSGIYTSDPVDTAVFGNNAFTQNNVHLWYANGDDNPDYEFDLTLAPGQTSTIMTLSLLTADINRGTGVDSDSNGLEDYIDSDIALGVQEAEELLNSGNPIDPDSWIFAGLTIDQVEHLLNWNIASTEIDTSQAFFDENSYAARLSPATFNGGVLKPTTTHTFTQPFIIDAAGGTVDDTNGNVTFSGIISGAGAFNVTGSNAVVLTAENTYTGGTNIESGTLQIGAGGTTGSIVGNVADSGKLAFNRTDNIEYDGVVSGTGKVEVMSGGVVFGAAQTYTGVTTIDSGATLQLGNGGTAGSVAGAVADNGNLLFDRSDDVSVANTISGTGGIEQVGGNTVTLTGTNTYTGATLIMSGVLNVNGSIAGSATTINSGGTLGGSGTVGATTVNSGGALVSNGTVGSTTVKSGGTISPGATSIATLTVHGNLGLNGGSTYVADISPTANDLITASGAATVGGLLQVNVGSGAYHIGQEITLLTADGGVTGNFSGYTLSDSFGTGFKPELSQDADNIYLLLAPNSITPLLPSTASKNDIAVATAIDALLQGDNGGAFTPLFGLTGEQLQDTITHLSGEIASTAQQSGMDLSAQFLGLMLDPLIDARGGVGGASGPALAFAPKPTQGLHLSLSMRQGPQRASFGDQLLNQSSNIDVSTPKAGLTASAVGNTVGVWVSAYGAVNDADGTSGIGSHDTHTTQAGIAAGVDVRLSDTFVIGIAGGGAKLKYNASDLMGHGSSDVGQGGFYLSKRFDNDFYVSFAADYSSYSTQTTRTVVLAGVNRYAAKFDSHDVGMRLEGGQRLWDVDNVSVTPYGALVLNHFTTPGYTETTVVGDPSFALAHPLQSHTEDLTELGFKFDTETQTDQVFDLHASAAWQHNYQADRNFTVASFAGLGGPAFTVQGASAPKDGALLSLGADTGIGGGFTIGVKVNGLIGDKATSYGGSGAISYNW